MDADVAPVDGVTAGNASTAGTFAVGVDTGVGATVGATVGALAASTGGVAVGIVGSSEEISAGSMLVRVL
jgi:hypothetical protein